MEDYYARKEASRMELFALWLKVFKYIGFVLAIMLLL